LVHSSTLVTAGLVFLFNFNFFILSGSFFKLLLLIGGFTISFSSVLAICEKDLKKIVALRTLSQIGFCFLSLGLGFFFFVFFSFN
jgi:NADH-quinone oxidoreductase subunit L